MNFREMTVGERLRWVRRNHLNLTMEELGRKIDKKNVAISQMELGKNNVTISNAKAICNAFNINYTWLMEGEGDIFLNTLDSTINELTNKYELDSITSNIIRKLILMAPDKRKIITDFIIECAGELK